MALPQIAVPEYQVELPSTGEQILFRPFLVKEEKVLLIALESEDAQQITKAVKKILEACIIAPENIDVSQLPSFDIEYLFLQLRGKSISDVITVNLKHVEGECEKTTEVDIPVDTIQIEFDKNHKQKIELTDKLGVVMKYPSMSSTSSVKANDVDNTIRTISSCINYVYDEDTVYDQFTAKEAVSFIESLSQMQLEKIIEFFQTMPKLKYTVKWKCGCGDELTVALEGLQSFFG